MEEEAFKIVLVMALKHSMAGQLRVVVVVVVVSGGGGGCWGDWVWGQGKNSFD